VEQVAVTKVLPATPEAIHEAVKTLRSGGLVAFPTETVYGLGADAENLAAIRGMFAAKGRPADHPVIVHLADASLLDQFAAEVPAVAQRLADGFWPGPITLVLHRGQRISDLVTGGLDTVGLRVPGHPVAQKLLREFGGPIAAPSANRFGRVSATSAEHVEQELAGRVDLILDGGPCQVGLESTIVDLTGQQARILRPGGITAEQIESALGQGVAGQGVAGQGVAGQGVAGQGSGAPRVSGSLPSHYAPQARLEIVSRDKLAGRARALAGEGRRVAILASIENPGHENIIVLVPPEGDEALAHSLYSLLRQVDEAGCDVALTTLPAEAGLGVAIADRLRRAAGPR
jgi:L-threonylcarbamoyladenylate synthase